jgi:hypothetical protein
MKTPVYFSETVTESELDQWEKDYERARDDYYLSRIESSMETGSGNAPELAENSRPAWSII